MRFTATLALAVTLSSCTRSADSRGGCDRVTTLSGLPVFESIALMQVAEQHPRPSEGARFVPWRNPEQVTARITSGEVDYAILAANQAALLAARGLQVRVLRVLQSHENLAILSKRAAPTLSEALRGSVIAAPFRHGLPALILGDLLESLGLDAEASPRVEFVETPLDAIALLVGGKADAAFLAEPMISIGIERLGAGVSRWGIDDVWRRRHPELPLAVSVLAAIGPASQDREALDQLGRRFDDGIDWLRKHPDSGATLALAHFPELPRAALEKGLGRVHVETLPRRGQCEAWLGFVNWVGKRDLTLLGGRLPKPGDCVEP